MAEVIYKDNILDSLKRRFEREEVVIEPTYERSFLDKKIERFLDEKFGEYIDEFGIITDEKLRNYDQNLQSFEKKVDALTEFIKNADRDIKDLEKRVEELKTAHK